MQFVHINQKMGINTIKDFGSREKKLYKRDIIFLNLRLSLLMSNFVTFFICIFCGGFYQEIERYQKKDVLQK